MIATMVGIVGILLLGSLAWSAVGALFSTVGEAAHAFSSGTPAPKIGLAGLGTPSPQPTPRSGDAARPPASVVVTATSTEQPTPQPTALSLTPTLAPTPEDTPTPATPTPLTTLTPTPSASGRSPWILLPGPAPGAQVQPGPQVIEARGRGDSAITAIRLELDGAALGVSFEQRSESVWRGSSTAQVAAGHHAVRAIVVDDQGRTGSFRWTFDAVP